MSLHSPIVMSDRHSDPRSGADAVEEYQLGKVTLASTGAESPVPYEYSDLETGSGLSALSVAVHTIYWPVYFMFFFPIQWMVRLFRWSFRLRHLTPSGRLAVHISDTADNVRKLKFLANYDRFVLYLRASRVFTPAQVFPFLSGTAPISESHSGEQRPRPQNWHAIRRSVYRRDNYRCVNCGKVGGSEGDAELHADHVVPRSRDGVDESHNLRTLCRACHEARHARIFE